MRVYVLGVIVFNGRHLCISHTHFKEKFKPYITVQTNCLDCTHFVAYYSIFRIESFRE
jgi:hypothetical protein